MKRAESPRPKMVKIETRAVGMAALGSLRFDILVFADGVLKYATRCQIWQVVAERNKEIDRWTEQADAVEANAIPKGD